VGWDVRGLQRAVVGGVALDPTVLSFVGVPPTPLPPFHWVIDCVEVRNVIEVDNGLTGLH
jgi:hypothetical protein